MGKLIIKLKTILKNGTQDLVNFGFKVMYAKEQFIIKNNSFESTVNKNKAIQKYLSKKYSYIIEKYNNDFSKNFAEINTENTNKQPIWVLWWQGKDNMPDIIKACYESKLHHSNGHPVIFIDKSNIKQYIDFPDYIWKQFETGKLRIQHLSDMARIKLIKEYGGLWLDASIYCLRDIPEHIFSLPLYSLKNKNDNDLFLSNDKWTTFTIGGQKNNLLCCFLDDFFMEYCKSGKPFIDYFMFDCAISLAKESIPAIRDLLNEIPFADGNYRWIKQHLFEEYNEQLLMDMQNDGSIFNKIPWEADSTKFAYNSLYIFLIKKELHNE